MRYRSTFRRVFDPHAIRRREFLAEVDELAGRLVGRGLAMYKIESAARVARASHVTFRSMPSSNRTADVVIIGGGIMGASVAYHLARRGCANVVVLERAEMFGLGSTGLNAGGVRHQFAT